MPPPCLLSLLLLTLALSTTTAFENVLSAAGEVRKDLPRLPLHTSRALHSVYSRTEHILSRMRDLTETCENATLGSVGGGGQGREDEELLYVTLTKKKRYVREHLLHRRTRVVFTFGETARESFVTTAIAMNMLEAACAPLPPREAVTVRSQVGPELPAASARHAGLRAKIAEVLEFAEVILVPLVSPTGRKLAESGGFCEVGNARGVDLNRNFPVHWGRLPEVDPSVRDPYPNRGNESESSGSGGNGNVPINGPQPFSEWETHALRTIVTNLQPSAFVSVSSGYELSLSPPGDCDRQKRRLSTSLEDELQLRLKAVSDRITAMHCWKCSQKRVVDLTGSGRCGSAVDWAFDTLSKSTRGGAVFVYSWRVYANPTASPLDCLAGFNPMTKHVLLSVVDRWGHAMLTLTRAVHDWRVELKLNGREVAMRNLSDAASSAVTAPAAAGRMDVDEEESLLAIGDDVHGGGGHRGHHHHHHPGRGRGGRSGLQQDEDGGERSALSLLALSFVACLATAAGLVLLRNFVFSRKLKRYRMSKNRGGAVWRAVSGNLFKVQ